MKGIPIELDISSLVKGSLQEMSHKLYKLAKSSIYFHELSQREFSTPRDYVKWNEFVNTLAFYLMTSDNINPNFMDYASANALMLIRDIYLQQPKTFHCYWLDANLMEAFLHTDLPNVMNMKRPHIYGTIFLPRNKLRSPDGYSVNWMTFAHRVKGETSQVQFPFGSFTQTHSEDVLQLFTSVSKNTLYFSSCSLERTDEQGLPYREAELFIENENNALAEKVFIDKLLSVALQCLLWLQIYQPIESVPSGKGFGPTTPQSPVLPISALNPRWIGKGYKANIGRVSTTSSHLTATNSCPNNPRNSPRTHWRRGHWRSQKIGVRRSQVKTVWIEPTLING